MRLPFLVVASVVALVIGASVSGAAGPPGITVVYDDFSAADTGKWVEPYGPIEHTTPDANHFLAIGGGVERMKAVPFTKGADFSVFDHLKLMEVSTASFPLPVNGSLTFSADITASTPGTVKHLTQQGIFAAPFTWTDPASRPAGFSPYAAKLLEGQQAGVVLNMIDFCTGQLFDWFLSSRRAFTLIERLPTSVTDNTTVCPGSAYVGRETMYTQIADEVEIEPGPHRVSIRVTQDPKSWYVEYLLDGKRVTKISNIGIPLDRQHVRYTGRYPSLGAGENLKGKIQSFTIGHGLFSLLDAFPYQHPEAPELSVSIPIGAGNPADAGRARLFGQGADGTFDNITVTTVGG